MSQEIIVFWDSITHGIYGEEGYSWCDNLKKNLQKHSWNLVYNLWIPWDTSADVLARFEYEISCRGHDIVLFAIGINDTRCIQTEEVNKTPVNIFSENLQRLIDTALKYTNKIGFIGMTPVRDNIADKIKEDGLLYFYSNVAIQRYDIVMKDILNKNNIPFIEVADCIEGSDLPDGLHPNQKGQKKMFDRITRKLIEYKFIEADTL